MRSIVLSLAAVMVAGAALAGGWYLRAHVDAPAAQVITVKKVSTDRAAGGRRPEFWLPDPLGVRHGIAEWDGKVLVMNFWATWCPPCQSETPVLRDMDAMYGQQGLSIVGIAVQETTPDDVRSYAQRYGLEYRIAFDASADFFNEYKVYALPTQFFIGPDGRILEVVNGPMTDASARVRIEAWLPQGGAAQGQPPRG